MKRIVLMHVLIWETEVVGTGISHVMSQSVFRSFHKRWKTGCMRVFSLYMLYNLDLLLTHVAEQQGLDGGGGVGGGGGAV